MTLISNIKEFFENQTIFLTGGTGFLGKVLIEKLIRECYNVKKIYVVIRPKKGKTAQQRFDEFFNFACFDLIKSKGLNYADKISLINGDCDQPFLGLSQTDINMLKQEVTCIIHAAANVRFNQTLKEATCIVTATRDLLILAKQMPKLTAFVYVSTAYSNCIHTTIKEQFYEPPIKAKMLIDLVDGLDGKIVEAITPHLLDKWPNTYVYAKCVTEDLLRSFGKDLPLAVVRPAIVVSTYEEPMPGWVDNLYGIMGIVTGSALGIIRSFHGKLKERAYLVPVDYVANGILAAAWNRNVEPSNDTVIYNYVGHHRNYLTWGKVVNLTESYYWTTPSEKMIWYDCCQFRENKLWHDICIILLHTIPAYIADFVLFCMRKPVIAVKNYRRLNKVLGEISYFATRGWHFDNDNVMRLWNKLEDGDKKLFKFDMEKLDWEKFINNAILGGRIHLLKDPLETIPKAKKKVKILFIAHYTVVVFALYFLFKLTTFVLGFF